MLNSSVDFKSVLMWFSFHFLMQIYDVSNMKDKKKLRFHAIIMTNVCTESIGMGESTPPEESHFLLSSYPGKALKRMIILMR